MLDNIKLRTLDQTIIKRLADFQGFEPYRHRNNNYYGLCRYGKLMRLDFRKTFENGNFVGFHHLEISISPHYHYNNYLHNGNDFAPQQCIKTIIEILEYIRIKPDEMNALKVVNIEFGLNIIPEIDIKKLIDNILYFRKTPFVIPNPETPYFKITDATTYKNIKAYAKGLQFAEFPQYGIDLNTFRFEVKSKKSANIKPYGIDSVTDLLNLNTYKRLSQEIINEWENVLITTETTDLRHLKPDEVQFIRNANKPNFWEDIKEGNRNKFSRNKTKYFKILSARFNYHTQIKGQIIDKLTFLQSGAYFPQRTPINTGKQQNRENTPKEINGQSAPLKEYLSYCEVTKLDISMQKKGSKFLCFSGLKFYKENDPATYQKLVNRYLTEKMKTRPIEDQFYYIAHNIRNQKTNPTNNRQRFEQRNYPKHQLQINFIN